MERKKVIILYSIIIPLFIGFIYLNYRGGLKEKSEYPMLTSSWELNSTIIEKKEYNYFNNRGIHFKTSKGEGFFFPTSCNYYYKEYLLSRFIQEGDSISKKRL